MKNKKGFTLIELLAVVIIMSILLAIAVPSISKYLKRGTVEYYHSIENEIKASGMDYFETYRSLLPRHIGNVSVITLEELVNNKYIDEVKDENGTKCEGQITAKKIDTGVYEYYSCLSCEGIYESKETCEYSIEDNVYADSHLYSIEVPSKSYTVIQSQEFELPFAKVYYDNQLINDKLKGNPSKIDTNILGKTEVIYFYNGVKEVVTVEVIDKTKPSKPSVVLKKENSTGASYVPTTWYSGNIYQQFKSTDYTKPGILGSGIKKYQISTDETNFTDLKDNNNQYIDNRIDTQNGIHKYYVKSFDNNGNESGTTEYSLKIDKETPTCVLEVTKGTKIDNNNAWYISDIEIGFRDKDEEMETVSSLVLKSISETSITTNVKNKKITGMVIDEAGNVGTCELFVNVDKKTPNPPTIVASDDIDSGNWHRTNTTLTFSGADNISDNTYYYGTSTFPKTAGSSYTRTTETDGTTYYVKVCSGAGLCSTNSSYNMKLDKTKPTCDHSGDSTKWTNSNRTISYKCSDSLSKCHADFSGGTKTFNSTTKTATIASYTIMDNAGNIEVCPIRTANVYVDTTKPTCDNSGDSTKWTNSSRTIQYKCVDGNNESGCDSSYSGGSKTFSTTTKTSTIASYTIKDIAGNSTTCPARTADVYVDTTKPTCDHSGDSTTWTNSSRTIQYKCVDGNNESGCDSSYSGGSKTFSTTTKTSTIASYTIKDIAGNSTTCPARTADVYVDTTKPTCDQKGSSTTWTNGNRTITYGCIDNDSDCHVNFSGGTKTYSTTKKTDTIEAYTIMDNAGNLTACSAKTTNIYVDKTAPSCTNSGDSTTWTNSDRTITYGCKDDDSDCDSSYSGGKTTFDTTKKTATIAKYTIKDKAGNSTTCDARTANVYVDKTAPSCTNSGDSTTWTNSDRTIYYGCSDDDSDCDSSYSGGSETFDESTTTSTIASYTIKDKVGNSTTCDARTANVYVDKDAPSSPTVALVKWDWSELSNNTWYNVDIYVAGKADGKDPNPASTDTGGSGIKKYQISTDNKTWVDWSYSSSSSTYKISTDGTTYRYIRAVDNAGNTSSVTTKTIKRDTIGPVLSELNNPSNGSLTAPPLSVTYKVSDASSGVSYCEYKYANDVYGSCNDWCLDDGTLSNGVFTATFSAERNTTVYFRCIDNVGNASDGNLSTTVNVGTEECTPTCSEYGNSYTGTTAPSGTYKCADYTDSKCRKWDWNNMNKETVYSCDSGYKLNADNTCTTTYSVPSSVCSALNGSFVEIKDGGGTCTISATASEEYVCDDGWYGPVEAPENPLGWSCYQYRYHTCTKWTSCD